MVRKVLSILPIVAATVIIGCASPTAGPSLDDMNAFSAAYSHASVTTGQTDGTYGSSGTPGDPDTYTVTTVVLPAGDEMEIAYDGLIIDYGGKTYIVSGTITVTDFNATPPDYALSFTADITVSGAYDGRIFMNFSTTFDSATSAYSAVGTITINGVPYSVSQFGVAP